MRAEAFVATQLDFKQRGAEGWVGMRKVEGEAVKLSDAKLNILKNTLLIDNTYFKQDSKGTQLGIAMKLHQRRAEPGDQLLRQEGKH